MVAVAARRGRERTEIRDRKSNGHDSLREAFLCVCEKIVFFIRRYSCVQLFVTNLPVLCDMVMGTGRELILLRVCSFFSYVRLRQDVGWSLWEGDVICRRR